MKGIAVKAAVVLAIVGIIAVVGFNYSYIFSKTVVGEIIEIERVAPETAIIGGQSIQTSAIFSYAVAIRTENGQIFTASSEDRQWAVAKKGYCVEAVFYPYPFWNLAKAGTYFNARLTTMFDCKPNK